MGGRSQEGQDEASPFTPAAVATPTHTAYRAYLQHTLHLKPASVNRSLVSLKRYFAWLIETGQIKHDTAKVHDLRHRFGYRMAESVPLHRLAQVIEHDSLDTTTIYVQATRSDLQKEVEKIAWV